MMGVVIGATVIDHRSQRVPNGLTLPAFALGVVLHYPAMMEVWVASLLAFAAWRARLTGGGDAKLWIALLWLTPTAMASWSLAVFAASMLLTGLGQKLQLHLQHIEPKPGPAAWRTLPYVVWVLVYLIIY